MDRVVGYVRVSTAGQAKDGFGLDEQREQILRYCEEHSFELAKIYEDAGISGAKVDEEDLTIDRPGLQDMLADLEDGDIKNVVVLTTSRLWRSDLVKVLIHRELRRHKVDVRAIDRPAYSIYGTSKDPSSFLVNGMMELLDQYERLEITLKLKRGRLRKASKGGYAGGLPAIGYAASRGRRRLSVDTEKAKTVQRVFELRSGNPAWSLKKIACQLNSEGHTTAEERAFKPMQVKRILDRAKLYSGIYCYGGVEALGQHTAIIGSVTAE